MLISHRHNFIYFKTKKTASTSVEVYFEKYCKQPGKWKFSHLCEEHIGEAGIIGARGPWATDRTWYNHMPAREIKNNVSPDVWDHYFKFTTIRNPFDKVVSFFHHTDYGIQDVEYEGLSSLSDLAEKWIWLLRTSQGGGPEDRFRRWARSEFWLDKLPFYSGFVDDRDVFTINGDICVDEVIRFETLQTGIERVCNAVGVPYKPHRLPELKSGRRPDGLKYDRYYDQKTAKMVGEAYQNELKWFEYDYPTVISSGQ